MNSLGTVVRSGVGRRRVQTVVIALSAFLAVTAAVLAGSLLVASTAPFQRSFTAQHGAHLSALFDGATVSAAQAAATGHAAGVAESSGPFPVVTLTPKLAAGFPMRPLTIAGRDRPTTGIDRVTLSTGRWASAPGEIVVTEGARVGTTLIFPGLPGTPSFTVVGLARSVSGTADAWVTPAAIGSLTRPGTTPGRQMLYRLTAAASTTDMDAGQAAIIAAVPATSLLGSQSWLVAKAAADRNSALFVPFLVAFGLLGLVMAVLSVGGVVAGAVGSATLRIGVLKALGFTPGQVVRAYLGQALIPAGIGVALGVVAGNLVAVPVLRSADDVYQSAGSGVAPWIDVAVVAGALAVVAGTAWVASWRAGRLRTADALAMGRAPRAGRGRWAAALASRLPLPRPVGLGLAQPFARPARALAMTLTVVFGAASVALAVGLATSLALVETARTHDTAQVWVGPGGPPESGPMEKPRDPLDAGGPDPAKIGAAIAAQPGTKAWYGILTAPATVAGLAGGVDLLGYGADASWAGFAMTEGRWFAGPGEAIAPTPLLTATGAKIGDTITLTVAGHRIPVRIVGEVFSTRNEGMQIFTDLRTITSVLPGVVPLEYRIAVAPGTDVDAYVRNLDAATHPLGLRAQANPEGHSSVLLALNTLTAVLTVMLVAVAALGVLNAVVLQTRERVRELGVHKAIGMTPRQAVTVVLSSVVLIGLIGGGAGVPLGIWLHGVLLPAMGDSAGVRLPTVVLDVYRPWLIAVLALGGLVIAVAGALLPAGWAARIRTATALRTE